jgi:WD40 repeat protein
MWDLHQSEAISTVLEGPKTFFDTVAFSLDGKRLAAGRVDRTISLWALQQPEIAPAILRGPKSPITALAFSADGKRIAAGSKDRTVSLWELQQPEVAPTVLAGPEEAVSAIAFSPDGKRLAVGSSDWAVWLWELSQLEAAPTVLSGPRGSISAVAFSPDGKRLAVGSSDWTVFIWIIDPTILTDIVCDKVRRNLALNEWRQFVGTDLPYERTCTNLPIHPSFIESGKDLARAGDIEGAVNLFQDAVKLGRVDELFDANPHGNEMYQSQKGLAQFLIPRGDTSKLFEIVEEPFYLLTELVEVFIIV